MNPTVFALVVLAAFIHAFWNILLKRVQGGLSFTWFVSILQTVVFSPWIAWVIYTEKPALGPLEWLFIAGSAVIHIAYYYFLQWGYRIGDVSLVYPVARGSGPLFSSLAAIIFLGERPGWFGVLGIVAIGVGIFCLTGVRKSARLGMQSVMTVAPVSQIAPTREISTLVGAFIGGRLFAEENLGRRLAAASIIVVGVLAVAHG